MLDLLCHLHPAGRYSFYHTNEYKPYLTLYTDLLTLRKREVPKV
jgi:hypothetical protein